jgi:large subunit ribosomal protein L24
MAKKNKRVKLPVRKGDRVMIISGESKGKIGTISQVFPEKYRAIVDGEGIKKAKRHVRPTAQAPGGIFERDIPIHISNLMLVDSDNNPRRFNREEHDVDGKMKTVRVLKKSKEVIE